MRGNAYYISLERQIWKKLQHSYLLLIKESMVCMQGTI